MYMDIKEFVDNGLLQELNRTFLHPLGLALEVGQRPDGVWDLVGVVDERANTGGLIYTGQVREDAFRKANKATLLREFKSVSRKDKYSYDIQPLRFTSMTQRENEIA